MKPRERLRDSKQASRSKRDETRRGGGIIIARGVLHEAAKHDRDVADAVNSLRAGAIACLASVGHDLCGDKPVTETTRRAVDVCQALLAACDPAVKS